MERTTGKGTGEDDGGDDGEDDGAPRRGWERALTWLDGLSAPRVRTAAQVTRAGAWTLRAMRWRQATRAHMATARELAERARAGLNFVFAVVTPPGTSAGDETADEPFDARWTPPVAPRARIVVNPHSGSVRGTDALRELREAAMWLTERGLPTELALTEAPGHATRLAREAVAAGMEMVIAAGGDGTLNDVVQGLAGTTTALGVLPMGTVNVWARETGIPLNNTAEAREILLGGVRRRVDLGRAGARYFLLMADIGFGAEVVKRVERSWMQRLGLKLIDYVLTAGTLGMTQQPARLWMRMNGKRRATHALMIVIGNTQLYGGTLTFTKHAIADDGWLDVVVIGRGGLGHRLRVMGRALLRRSPLGPRVRYDRARSVRFESIPPLPVQVDGELLGHLPMTFSTSPGALTVIVPETTPHPVFSRDPLA